MLTWGVGGQKCDYVIYEWPQGFSTWDTNAEDENDMDPEKRKKKAQKLTEALAVLAVRPPSFNSLFTAGRLEQVIHN